MSEMTVVSRRNLLRQALAGTAAVAGSAVLGPWNGLALAGVVPSDPSARPAPAGDFDATVATAWFDEILALIRTTPGFSPPVASRAIGYAGVTLYEAILPGLPGRRSLPGQLTELPVLPAGGRNAAYHWPTVANAALAEIVRALCPTATAERLAAVARLEATFLAAVPRGIRERSIDRGRAVAQAVFDWSRTDGGHEGYAHNFDPGYVPPIGPGLWQPTPPGFLPALQPGWGRNRTFMASGPSCDPGAPIRFDTAADSACFAEAFEVFQTVDSLTSEQLAIARFWSDDPGSTATPPGHSVSILTQVVRARDESLAVAAEMYARLGIAVADAFIACWGVKYRYNVLRPITYIRATIDPHWGSPLPLVTPPFPEYTSGHSVQSAAAAAVLTAQFGPVSFVDHTHDSRGLPARSFDSFDAAAAEAAISRLYGGIHYRGAIERGLAQGRCVGERAAALDLEDDPAV